MAVGVTPMSTKASGPPPQRSSPPNFKACRPETQLTLSPIRLRSETDPDGKDIGLNIFERFPVKTVL
jgi:hypothetical protein